MRVRGALRLSQYIRHTHTLQHGTHCTTGNNSRTMRSWLNKHLSTAKPCRLFVGDSTFQDRNFRQVLLGSLYTFGNGCGHFTGFTQSPADNAFFITNYNNSCKSKSSTTLRNLSYAIDGNQSIFQLYVV